MHYMPTTVGYHWFAILETPHWDVYHGPLVSRFRIAPGGIGADPQASVPMLITEYFRIFPPAILSYLGGVHPFPVLGGIGGREREDVLRGVCKICMSLENLAVAEVEALVGGSEIGRQCKLRIACGFRSPLPSCPRSRDSLDSRQIRTFLIPHNGSVFPPLNFTKCAQCTAYK